MSKIKTINLELYTKLGEIMFNRFNNMIIPNSKDDVSDSILRLCQTSVNISDNCQKHILRLDI